MHNKTTTTTPTSENIQKITESFNVKKEYTKNEMANIWNNEVDAKDLNVVSNNNGNTQSYIAIEEDGNKLVVSQYDNNDNVVKSETIIPQNGKYNAEAIKNTIEKVTGVYEENNENKTLQKSNFYDSKVKYQVSNINEIEKGLSKNKTYTLEEISDKWDNIMEDTYDLTLQGDNYVSLDEDNGKLEAVLYDGETSKAIDSVEIKKNKDGKYSSTDINNAVKKVATIIDKNKPIKGQVDIEGNEVRSIKNRGKNSQIKNSLNNYSDKRIKSTTSNKNAIIVKNEEDLKFLIKQSFEDTDSQKILHIGILPSETISKIKNEITQIKKENINDILKDDIEYSIAINQNEIRHLTDKAGMTINKAIDFVLELDKLLTNFDSVSYHTYNKNQNALRFKKKIKNDTVIAFDVISNTKRTIRIQSIFFENDINKDTEKFRLKNKKRRSIQLTPDDTKSPSNTSKTDSLSTSSVNNSIPQNKSNVKNDTAINHNNKTIKN